MNIFSISRAATLTNLSLTRRELGRHLRDLRLDEDLIADVQLATMELATNAIRHAPRKPKTMTISGMIDGSSLAIVIEEDGEPWVDLLARMESARRGIAQREAESGRGLMLSARALDKIDYVMGPINRLTLRRRLHRRVPLVLLVEDDRELLDVFTYQLGGLCRTVTANDVETAGHLLTTMPIDCVVSDLHLGEGNGNGLIEYLEKDPERVPIPIVIVTGDADRDVQRLSLEIGVEAVLTKPVTGAQLLTSVQTAIIRSERQKARLMRHFSKVLEGLLASDTPETITGFNVVSREATASLGGGDATVHFTRGNTHRIVMLDAMGHGLGAKAVAVALVTMARTLETIIAPESPAAFLLALSALVAEEDTMAGFVATAMVVDLTPEGVVIASAGHPRPVLIRNGELTALDISGPPLGMIFNDAVVQELVPLAPGERIFACSDGLDTYGLGCGEPPPEWLSNALIAPAPSEEASATIITDLAIQTLGPEPEDDWSFMLIGRAV